MDLREWLEADGLGGFASGTVSGVRTRRYHALLLAAATPPTGRQVLVSGVDVVAVTPRGRFALSAQMYRGGVVSPDGHTRIESFTADPWPRWRFRLEDGTVIEHELLVRHGSPRVALSWRILAGEARLEVRPFLAGRDYHSLAHEAPFDFEPARVGDWLRWGGVFAGGNGSYRHDPHWYRGFLYQQEQARGLDCEEDLPSPGVFELALAKEAVLVLSAEPVAESPLEWFETARADERARRRRFASPLLRAADAYLVRRGAGRTIVAGYPWFTDWGRDTFIALRGLCLATGRLDDARAILLEWAGAVEQGMLPNRFPDRGERPEFNSVDASLWYIVAVHDYLEARRVVPAAERATLTAAVESILLGYARGTRYGIRVAPDFLLASGAPGVQLTWMDAKVGDWVVTPRAGKPVEVQALWVNALRIGALVSDRFAPLFADLAQRAHESFLKKFWNAATGCLYDVLDPDDGAVRPNQIFAVGGLPFALLEGARARAVVDTVLRKLWTPLGLRSLAPDEPGYEPRYQGGVRERDGAYHQGTVWPWLLGPFCEAWVRVHGTKAEARRHFLEPLVANLERAGLGHLPEVADADTPHTPGGCPFQAWSLAEALRLIHVVLAGEESDESHGRQAQPAQRRASRSS